MVLMNMLNLIYRKAYVLDVNLLGRALNLSEVNGTVQSLILCAVDAHFQSFA
jgi:hypothetical protein